jgi:hypothetical protein
MDHQREEGFWEELRRVFPETGDTEAGAEDPSGSPKSAETDKIGYRARIEKLLKGEVHDVHDTMLKITNNMCMVEGYTWDECLDKLEDMGVFAEIKTLRARFSGGRDDPEIQRMAKEIKFGNSEWTVRREMRLGTGRGFADATSDFAGRWTEPDPFAEPTEEEKAKARQAQGYFRSIGKELAKLKTLTAIPPREWLVQDFLEVNTLAVLGGPGGAGKSSLLNTLACSVATGQPLLHSEMTVRGGKGWPVLILNDDDSTDELMRRFGGIAQKKGLNFGDIDGVYFCGSDELPDIKMASMMEEHGRAKLVLNEEWFAWVGKAVSRMGVKMLVLDPLNGLAEMVENDNTGMGLLSRRLNKFAREIGCSVVLVHHANKAGSNAKTDGDRSADMISGAKRLQDKARSSWMIDLLNSSDLKAMAGNENDPRKGRLVGMWMGKVNNIKGVRGRPRWTWEMEGECLGNARGLDAADWVQVPKEVVLAGSVGAAVLAGISVAVLEVIERHPTLSKKGTREDRSVALKVIAEGEWDKWGCEPMGEAAIRKEVDTLIKDGLVEEVDKEIERPDGKGADTRKVLVLTPDGYEKLKRHRAEKNILSDFSTTDRPQETQNE